MHKNINSPRWPPDPLEQRLGRIEAALVEVLALLKHNTSIKVMKKEAVVFFLAKIEEIYFNHASFESDKWRQLKVNGSEELILAKGGNKSNPPKLSSGAKVWIHASLTPLVHTHSFGILFWCMTNKKQSSQLSTRRAPLQGAVKEAILANFKVQWPWPTLPAYKAKLLAGTLFTSLVFCFKLLLTSEQILRGVSGWSSMASAPLVSMWMMVSTLQPR
jgi:hypothetical protein